MFSIRFHPLGYPKKYNSTYIQQRKEEDPSTKKEKKRKRTIQCDKSTLTFEVGTVHCDIHTLTKVRSHLKVKYKFSNFVLNLFIQNTTLKRMHLQKN